MSAPTMVSERVAVLRERRAFEAGLDAACWRDPFTRSEAMTRARADAADRYPLPKIVRQRFVRDPQTPHWEWTVEDGEIELVVSRGDANHIEYRIKLHSDRCRSAFIPIRERVEVWADLLARPFDKFDDPSDSGSPVSEAGR